jgi:ribosomal RNA methyltransferase Nop2
MVYSTCSISVFENEEVVNYALEKRDIKIVDTELDFGKFAGWHMYIFHQRVKYLIIPFNSFLLSINLRSGTPAFTRYQQKRFHPSLSKTRRFYPHVHNMDGFYVAKIQKLSDNKKGESEPKPNENEDDENKIVAEENSDVKKQNKTHGKKKGKRKGGKGKDEETNPARMVKRMKVSVPPKKNLNKKKEKNQNAKMTKPRRRQKVDE